MDRLNRLTGHLKSNNCSEKNVYDKIHDKAGDTKHALWSESADTNTVKRKFYSYTCDQYAPSILSESQRDFYEENGYIIIRNLLPKKNCDILMNHFNELIKNPSIRNKEIAVMKDIAYKSIDPKEFKDKSDPSKIGKIQNVGFDDVYNKYYETNEGIIRYVRAIIGDNLRSIDHIHIQKPPDLGLLSSRHPLHQDLWYFGMTNFNKIVGCWTALEHGNRHNGGLCVVPGSHKPNILYNHTYPKNSFNEKNLNIGFFAIPQDVFDKVKRHRIHLDMNPGDTLFFHPLLIHGSSANLSKDKTRHAFVNHYVNSQQVGFADYLDRIDGKVVNKSAGIRREKVWKVISRQITGNVGPEWCLSKDELAYAEKHIFKRKMNASNWTL